MGHNTLYAAPLFTGRMYGDPVINCGHPAWTLWGLVMEGKRAKRQKHI